MTMALNPYASDLGDRDPLQAYSTTAEEIRKLVAGWPAERLERSYAPGKWSARKILIHLAQTEIGLTTRARLALTLDDYQAQPFSQDDWLPLDDGVDARTALEAYTSLRRFNTAMFRRLKPNQLAIPFRHPEYGLLNVGWILAQMAGHDIHHLKQLTAIEAE
jgi:hypothetical protein